MHRHLDQLPTHRPHRPHGSSPRPRRARRGRAAGSRRVRLVAVVGVALATLGSSPATVDAAPAAAPDRGLAPVAECVIVNGDGSFTAFFGYTNASGRTVEMRVGDGNRVQGARATPPQSFAPGRHVAVLSATSRAGHIRWRLAGGEAVATPRSQPCSTNPSVPEAPSAVLMMLAPAALTGWWLRRRAAARPC